MTMETLKNLKEVNGKPILHMTGGNPKMEVTNITVNHINDSITFNMLTKPASDGGDLSRCQLTELVEVAKHMLENLDKQYPCHENAVTIAKLEEALMWQKKRIEKRIARGVEGKYEK